MSSTTRSPETPEVLAAALASTLAADAAADSRELLERSVRLLWRERCLGNVCLPLAAWAGLPAAAGEAALPPLAKWRQQLLASGCVATTANPAAQRHALLLDGADRLYLLRDFRSEQILVSECTRRLAQPSPWPAASVRAALTAEGLLPPSSEAAAAQVAAIALLLRSRFGVLCGGPGAGKTTTIARLLRVLHRLAPGQRVALAAPTGKAAARMAEALREHGKGGEPLTTAPTTLHRLLGYHPGSDRFRHRRDAPLAVDLLVIDEASMIEPALLAAVLQALPPQSLLLLLGDRDQLAAVGTGQVLGDICRAARPELGPGAAGVAWLRDCTGSEREPQPAAATIANAVAWLPFSHRFGKLPGIGGFAAAMARRDDAAAHQTLLAGHADLQLLQDPSAAMAALQPLLRELLAANSAAVALQLLSRLRVLTATRHGPMGSAAWNQRVEAGLRALGCPLHQRYYRLRPILITSNDPDTRLWNGDLGVVWPDELGEHQVWFAAADDGPRPVRSGRLPPHETAWAMTVHKAQGSEFDHVLLAMPPEDGPLWQAPLLYTGITRARQRAMVLADAKLLRAALGRYPDRSSGLADGLRSVATARQGSP